MAWTGPKTTGAVGWATIRVWAISNKKKVKKKPEDVKQKKVTKKPKAIQNGSVS